MPDRVALPVQPGFHVMAKPTGAICNLDCDYCYFLSKEMLYPGSRFRMARETLERYVRQLIETQPGPEVAFAWQGGEPTLMGLPFFEEVVALQRLHRRPGQRIVNTLQTNATRLDDDWGAFLRRHGFLVGVSIDGPREAHDAYRVDKAGRGSFDAVMRGVEVLKRHGVAFNVLTTVHRANQDQPLAVYRFLRDEVGASFLQFIPIVERENDSGFQEGEAVTERSVAPAAYGRFMTRIFDEWARRDIGRVYVQLFDVTLAKYVGEPGGLCVFEETCGRAVALEHTGDVYSCDHYVQPDHLLGNLEETALLEMVDSDAQRVFGEAKRDGLPAMCRACDVRWLCHGGCPKDRIRRTPQGEPGLNYLCEGYQRFFRHTGQAMRYMAEELRNQRPPAGLMKVLRDADGAQPGRPRPSPNRPCPCGSGRKYKHCCGKVSA